MKDVRELVKVKPLEWAFVSGQWRADFGGDSYFVYEVHAQSFRVEAYTTLSHAPSVNSVFFGSIEQGKAACTAHHESRIYALLEAV